MLNWLFYRPLFGNRLDRGGANPWQEYWGDSYAPELKQRLLERVFGKLETEEKIGNLIIDIGSGAWPVTRLLKTKPGRKRVCVDIAADNVGSLDELRIRLDAEKVGQFGALSFRKAILRVCAFLEIDPKTDTKAGRADTIVVSDTLNYVDFGRLLDPRRFGDGAKDLWTTLNTVQENVIRGGQRDYSRRPPDGSRMPKSRAIKGSGSR
jgi:hypothetical protein